MFHAGSRPQTGARQTGRKDQEMAQRTFSKMGRVNVMAALCAALAALLASGALLGAVSSAGPSLWPRPGG